MNDCFWEIIQVYDCHNRPEVCREYIPLSSDQGDALRELYGKDITQAITPVKDRWKKRLTWFKAVNSR